MKVPFTLQRIDERHPVAAVLVPTTEPGEVLSFCERLSSWPKVFRTAEGYLLTVAKGEHDWHFTGTIHLRELAPNLLLPCDAELIPPLLTDEATGLVKNQGLVFLPGGKVLAYQPGEPLSPSALLGVKRLERKTWQPLPEPPTLADQLREVRLEVTEPPPEELLQAGNEDIGSESPLAPSSGLGSSLAGQAGFGVGKFLAGLGAMLHWKGLANLGAKMMQGAMGLAPKLSEKLFGQQEAMLRRLLQAFKDGRIDDALRRALPLAGNDVVRGLTPAQNAQLPFHNLFYSLSNLLGCGGSGAGGLWLTQDDVYRQLQAEYRKQAEATERRGDFRRAAFIYGKLLSDFRSAVLVLSRGGLHRDAAILLLQKLNDPLAAAKEFEAAGEFDRALQLYRQQDDHERAGDLLKRMGEEEEALTEYKIAADMLIQRGKGSFAAGELLRLKAERPDLALPYYRSGWEHRPHDAAFPCASQLARHYTDTAAVPELLTLVEEAEDFFAQPGHETAAANFFNELVNHANRPALAEQKDSLRDRSLIALSAQMRRRIHSAMPAGQLVSMMLPARASWSAAQRSDAEHAVKAATKGIYKLKEEPPPANSIKINARTQVVTAVAWCNSSSELFLGFESGEIVCYRPATNEIQRVGDCCRQAVHGLVICDAGRDVIALRAYPESDRPYNPSFTTGRYVRKSQYEFHEAGSRCLQTDCAPWFCSQMDLAQTYVVLDGSVLYRFSLGHHQIEETNIRAVTPVAGLSLHGNMLCVFGNNMMVYRRNNVSHIIGVGWEPALPSDSTLKQRHIAWTEPRQNKVDIAGMDSEGWLHVSEIALHEKEATAGVIAHHNNREACHHAVCFLLPSVVAAVTQDSIRWFRFGKVGFSLLKTTPSPFVNPIACFPLSSTRELLVVCSDGTVGRVPFGV
jgi:tetratricopeptide (TPR) repeat protein